MWKFALVAAVMAVTALLAAATPMEWHVAVYAGISSGVATTLFAMACRAERSDRPEMLVVTIAAVGLSAAPSIRHRDGTPTLIVPCALIAMGARSHSDADKAVLALSGVVVPAAGVGTMPGTLIGALIIGVLNNGMNMLSVPYFYQLIVKGAVILVAVWLDVRAKQRKD